MVTNNKDFLIQFNYIEATPIYEMQNQCITLLIH